MQVTGCKLLYAITCEGKHCTPSNHKRTVKLRYFGAFLYNQRVTKLNITLGSHAAT